MNFPKISIITPSFNQGEFLEETILSVLNQGYPNIEYIIVDGGSTDNSIEIIKRYETRLSYWVSEKDNGMYDAIQKGFEKSSGDIMAWINSDDWYHPKSFFVVAEIFTNYKNVEWLQGLPSIIDEAGRIVAVHNFRKWSKYEFLIGEYEFIQQESCFWRRHLWDRSGGKLDISLKYAGDFALWLNFFSYAELYCTNTILGGFRARSKNQFSVDKLDEYREEANKFLKLRQHNLLPGERKHLNWFSLYKTVICKVPIVRFVFKKMYIEKLYPPNIYFDRALQKFLMTQRLTLGFNTLVKFTIGKFKKKIMILFLWQSF
jgi:glycosyltransferase involved in cell wall biosynthesis